ncbi:MAG: CPBP family intramembrane metalloprotease [Clostridia bacterium]|nr:CPBP family intramembrane metalloprotease [Clostridia bacterium]
MKFKATSAAPLLIMAVFLLTAVFNFLPAESIGAESDPYLAAVIIQLVIFALPSLLFCTLRGNSYSQSLRLRLPGPSSVILMICSVVLLCCGGSAIDYLMTAAFPSLAGESSMATYAGFAMNSGFFDGLYLVVAFAVLPAVTEEFLFRGIVLAEYGTVNVACSVILSAAMFSMCHFSFLRLPSYFFCGIVLACITYATRSIVAPMIVHTLYNVVVLFFGDYVMKLAEKNNISGILFVIVAAAVAFVAAAMAAFEASSIYRRYAEDNVESDHVPKKKTGLVQALAMSLLSPFFLLLIVVFIVLTMIV